MIILAINTKLHFQYRLIEKDNPFHAGLKSFPCSLSATVEWFYVFFQCSMQSSRYFLFLCKTHATSMQNPRKKSCDSQTSTFVNFSDLNISLTVLYDKNMYLAIRVLVYKFCLAVPLNELKVSKSFP